MTYILYYSYYNVTLHYICNIISVLIHVYSIYSHVETTTTNITNMS